MAKASEAAQIEFIKDRLRVGDSRKSILGLFGAKWGKVSKNTFDRRLSKATKEVQGEQQRIQAEAEKGVIKQVEGLESKIMGAVERKMVLTQIARGEIPLIKPMVCDGMIQEVPVVPDWMDRKNAIAELNKMDGDYAPIKQDLHLTGTKISVKLNK